MASLGLRTGGALSGRVYFPRPKIHPGRLPSKVTMSSLPTHSTQRKQSSGKRAQAQIEVGGHEKFDGWMKDSVVEIVKNLQEAPLFVHVYGGDRTTRMKAEKAVAEDWSHMKRKWVEGEEASPEGIILVEEINVDEEEGKMGILEEGEGQNGESTKAWGVLIQGKGEDGGVACYLLKTSKAGGSNVGLFCTHYCLVRVKSFRESARSQLTNCWLV